MATYRIKHITRYTYTAPVIDSANQIMLYPVEDQMQEEENHSLTISYNPKIDVYDDFFGNRAGLFTIIAPHHELNITSDIQVTTHPVVVPGDEKPAEEQWNHLKLIGDVYTYQDFLTKEAFDKSNEVLAEVQQRLDTSATPFQIAQNLSAFVYDHFAYKKRNHNNRNKD